MKKPRKRLGFISLFRGSVVTKTDPETGAFGVFLKMKDLRHTVQAQIDAQLAGKPPPLECMNGAQLLRELKGKKKSSGKSG